MGKTKGDVFCNLYLYYFAFVFVFDVALVVVVVLVLLLLVVVDDVFFCFFWGGVEVRAVP